MAGDWIKMRAGLLTNPKTIQMARILSEDHRFKRWFSASPDAERDATGDVTLRVTVVTRLVVATLLMVWSAANESADDQGFIRGLRASDIDVMAGDVPGFGAAMAAVGWLVELQDGTQLPNFQEHNTVDKVRKSSAAERQRRYRERKKAQQSSSASVTSDVTGDVTQTQRDTSCHTTEKRREDIHAAACSDTHNATSPGSSSNAASFDNQSAEDKTVVFSVPLSRGTLPVTRAEVENWQAEHPEADAWIEIQNVIKWLNEDKSRYSTASATRKLIQRFMLNSIDRPKPNPEKRPKPGFDRT